MIPEEGLLGWDERLRDLIADSEVDQCKVPANSCGDGDTLAAPILAIYAQECLKEQRMRRIALPFYAMQTGRKNHANSYGIGSAV